MVLVFLDGLLSHVFSVPYEALLPVTMVYIFSVNDSILEHPCFSPSMHYSFTAVQNCFAKHARRQGQI